MTPQIAGQAECPSDVDQVGVAHPIFGGMIADRETGNPG
jgi:hypothetical protein